MYLLGIDLGTSSIKVSVIEAATQRIVSSAQYPEVEAEISSPQVGWAEQNPETWWKNTKNAIKKSQEKGNYDPKGIQAIGIAYQMHGLVVLDAQGEVLRPSIIWCDSRAVEYGDKAFSTLGKDFCLEHHLNSPGNFTAAKLAWVKENEPAVYEKIDKVMLPGEYLAYKLSGALSTSISALSEGIFWDFVENKLSTSVLKYFGFPRSFFPDIQDVFSVHGELRSDVAAELGLRSGIPIAYKSGDQPNNAFSLNVLEPGEVAATAGTSGVIYGVSDALVYDPESRVNTFAHVNYTPDQVRTGTLLCINGTGILYSWAKKLLGNSISYQDMNASSAAISAGAEGLRVLPFGNGAERIFHNRTIGAHFENLDLNRHHKGHFLKGITEGIAFSFRYGLDIMRENGMNASKVKAGHANLFLSEVFQRDFVEATGLEVELYDNDGSVGAALGAGLGSGAFASAKEAFLGVKKIKTISPQGGYEDIYENWKEILTTKLNK
ncbi:xylulokinase [Leadbetterella byssophila]|uniref:xylulokinase n=1 Tax=Leadbetterella byssophila TaxID=316068 RepID=UPI0039A025BA